MDRAHCWLCEGKGLNGCKNCEGKMWDLRLGDYRDVMQDVTCDLLCVDAPYSAKTHSGHDAIMASAKDSQTGLKAVTGYRRPMTYTAWGKPEIDEFVDFWHARTRGWFVTMTDHILAPIWADALERSGRYVFSPLAYVVSGSRFRMVGDGPSQWAIWIVVARPRKEPYSKWGSLPGAYIQPQGMMERHDPLREIGGKDAWIMRSLVEDYSRAGNVVCDPCSGFGTTGAEALKLGRRFIGSEIRQEAYDKAHVRLSKPIQVSLLTAAPAAVQVDLFDTPT